MILISFGVMGYGIYQGLTYNQAYAAVIAGAGMVFIAAMGVRYVLELRAASSEVSVFHDGIELYDRRNRSRRFFPTKIKIPKEDISDIKIAASLEMNRDPSTIRPGIDDMVISTKSGKDLYLMQRPFSQLREAATLMGFSESVTGLATITRQPMDPVSYENTNDDLQYKTVERKLIIGFSRGDTRDAWHGPDQGVFLMVDALTSRHTHRCHSVLFRHRSPVPEGPGCHTDPGQHGMEWLTMIFRDGTTRFVPFSRIKRVALAFPTASGTYSDRPRRGYVSLDNITYSVTPEIALGIREGYRSQTGHYPFQQPS